MIGCFEPRKDYLTYLQVAKDLVNKRDDITFIAIGDGSTFNIINNIRCLVLIIRHISNGILFMYSTVCFLRLHVAFCIQKVYK